MPLATLSLSSLNDYYYQVDAFFEFFWIIYFLEVSNHLWSKYLLRLALSCLLRLENAFFDFEKNRQILSQPTARSAPGGALRKP
ncbi:hypothetical protein DP117_19275 [Brasilonema sp. UFV-L1]|nr:hypothetical protein [Brasilonema sp. UFV-L1]